jgi:hypothetical protein
VGKKTSVSSHDGTGRGKSLHHHDCFFLFRGTLPLTKRPFVRDEFAYVLGAKVEVAGFGAPDVVLKLLLSMAQRVQT